MSELGDQLRAEAERIMDEPMPEPSEHPEIETEGVFDSEFPELNLSGIFSGLPGMLTDTLGKVLTDSIRRMTAKPKMEFRVREFSLSTSHAGPDNTAGIVASIKERNKNIEDLLNDGWEIYEQISCPPNVMLIFSRERQERQTNNNGSDKETAK